MSNLYEAFNQWYLRPEDERFSSVTDMLVACKRYCEQARESTIPAAKLKVTASRDNEVQLVGQSGLQSNLSYWSFGQLAGKARAPANYLRALPAEVAANCLNYGFENLKASNQTLELLFHQPAHPQNELPGMATARPLLLRALTSDKYRRIWNYEVVEELSNLLDDGWRVPPARPSTTGQPGARRATKDDLLRDSGFGLSIREGDWIAPAGLYASDHDMFAFLILENQRLNDRSDGGLSRGVFFENSEVGDRSLRYTTFLYRHVCGNHIVWDVGKVERTKIRHVGDARQKFKKIFAEIARFQNRAASSDEKKINRTQTKMLGKSPEEVIDFLFRRLYRILSRQQLEGAFDLAAENSDVDGDPRSAWGMAQGITRLSQQNPFMDERTNLDRAAGRVLRIAF